jgi:hypothetical protein
VIILFSVKAGLRAAEIANLTWEMVLDPSGAIGTVLELRDHAANETMQQRRAMADQSLFMPIFERRSLRSERNPNLHGPSCFRSGQQDESAQHRHLI